MSKNLVIMFTKNPELGFVKTRLAKNCGEEFTLELYKKFVFDLVEMLKKSDSDFKLCGFPSLSLINNIFGNYDNFLQVDGDLGIKMKNAFKNQFMNGYDKIVLIGTDTPHISNELVNESFKALDSNDIVLGPSEDGGYYLIAFNKKTFIPSVFENISWSTSNVLKQTLHKLHTKRVYLLKELNDIDEIEDLNQFFNKHENSYFKDSNTVLYLKENNSWKNLM